MWKRIALFLALAITLVAAYFAPAPESEIVAPADRPKVAAGAGSRTLIAENGPGKSGNTPVRVLSIRSRESDDDTPEVFAPTQWTPLAPANPTLVMRPPEPPRAPPLPFRVLGRYVEDGKVLVFLQYNNRNLVVKEGDTIESQYKVESIGDGALTLVYIPLDQRQTLALGSAK